VQHAVVLEGWYYHTCSSSLPNSVSKKQIKSRRLIMYLCELLLKVLTCTVILCMLTIQWRRQVVCGNLSHIQIIRMLRHDRNDTSALLAKSQIAKCMFSCTSFLFCNTLSSDLFMNGCTEVNWWHSTSELGKSIKRLSSAHCFLWEGKS
jgi:hypothetical protein